MSPFHLDRSDAFSAAECETIITLAKANGLEPATVLGATGDEVAPERRSASRCALAREPASAWIFDRLDALFAEAAERFGLTADPVFETVQVVRYGPGDHFQSWHTDSGFDRIAERQVSLSAELSEPDEHQGGTLEIAPATVGHPRTLPRGGARLFPSRALHRVTPVTRGERWALVAWTGKAPG